MLGTKDEIRIEQAIVHILDSSLGMPVLSDVVLDCGSDFSDFLKGHIFKGRRCPGSCRRAPLRGWRRPVGQGSPCTAAR